MLTYSLNNPEKQKSSVVVTVHNTVQLFNDNNEYFGNIAKRDNGTMTIFIAHHDMPVSLDMVPALADMITASQEMLGIPHNIPNKKIDYLNYSKKNLWSVVDKAIDYSRIKNTKALCFGK